MLVTNLRLWLYRMTRQCDKKPVTGGNRSKLDISSPSMSYKAGYKLAPSRSAAHDDDLHLSGQNIFSVPDTSERLVLRSYQSQAAAHRRSNSIQETSYILDERPPVEGRDSLSKEDKVDNEVNLNNDDFQSASYVPPSRSNIATIRELRCARPNVEPLPLLQQRSMVDLDSSGSRDVSPLTKTQLFTDELIQSPLSDIVAEDANVDLEYDDYMPQLPGSYFTMDPQAYTLTWSGQPPWAHQPVISRTASDSSVDRSIRKTD